MAGPEARAIPDDTLADLVVRVPPLSPNVRTLAAHEAFAADPHLYAIAVVDEAGTPLGLINRFRFFERLSQAFGRDLLENQDVSEVMDPAPLVVDEYTTLEALSDILSDGGTKYIFDGFIVTSERRYVGIATGYPLMRRLTERRQAALMRLAYHDALTGLPNRQLFQDRLHQALANAARNHKQLAVLYLDLDRFKEVNDTFGHQVGDQLLRLTAERFRTVIRAQDTVARMSGDEFAVLIMELGDARNAELVAEKLISLFAKPFAFDGREVSVSCSVGIAIFPDNSDSQATLLRMADDALYCAKRTRNTFQRYSSDMIRSTSIGPLVFDTVRRAIDLNQLELHYQPQADVQTGALTGLEALVRWRDPSRGLVPAPDLIRLAEDTGLMSDITNFVCRRALQQLRDWRPMGLAKDLRLAINIAGANLRDGILASMLQRYTDAVGLPMSVLELQITESALMHADASATAVLTELQRDGVRVAVDDFGTGYSSLARLQSLPVDVLKIDKMFVDDVGSETRQSALARAIIIMAHALGLTVVAEGVETAEQYEFLRTHGCDEYQGSFLSPALPAAEVSQLLVSLPPDSPRLHRSDGGSVRHPARVSPKTARRTGIRQQPVLVRPKPR